MRQLILISVALCLALVAAVPTQAQDCRTPYRYSTPYVAPAYVEKKVVVEVVPPVVATIVQFVQVPLYSATYLPAPALVPGAVSAAPVAAPYAAAPAAAAPAAAAPAVSTPAAAPAPAPDAVLAALARLETRLDRLERGGTTPPPPAPDPGPPADPFAPLPPAATMPPAEPQARADPMTGLFTARCASCHDRPVAEQKGGGLTLTEGGRPAVLTPATRLKVWQQAHAGKMPQGGPRLAAAELAVLDRWLASP